MFVVHRGRTVIVPWSGSLSVCWAADTIQLLAFGDDPGVPLRRQQADSAQVDASAGRRRISARVTPPAAVLGPRHSCEEFQDCMRDRLGILPNGGVGNGHEVSVFRPALVALQFREALKNSLV
jgi:hypothetical protein